MAKKERSDADRRVRQCERLGRLLRLLHLIMGKGRWDAGTLAEELECSRRTVYRLLQTLSVAGIPWFFDETARCYRVRQGFKFPVIEPVDTIVPPPSLPHEIEPLLKRLIAEGEVFSETLRQFLAALGRGVG